MTRSERRHVSEYRVGSQPPDGYVARSLWADAQLAAGLSQKRCSKCHLWRFPQEMAGPVCRECGPARRRAARVEGQRS